MVLFLGARPFINRTSITVMISAILGSLMTIVFQQFTLNEKDNNNNSIKNFAQNDDEFISMAHQERKKRKRPPKQSNFRVTAVVVYSDQTIESTSLINLSNKLEYNKVIIGHNDESCCLVNSCCAEKGAFLQLACQPEGTIVSAVYLVSDSPESITPGIICREFMLSSHYISDETRIIMEGNKGISTRTICRLIDLYPYPSPYLRLNSQEQVQEGERLQNLMKKPKGNIYLRIKELAMKGCHYDKAKELHPIIYGAAIIFSDNDGAFSGQKKAIEYGCSQDPICQLAPYIEMKCHPHNDHCQSFNSSSSSFSSDPKNMDDFMIKPWIICMCDQYGVCHSPFSSGRAYLVEHGFGDVKVLCQDQFGNYFTPLASELIPGVPEWTRP